MENIVPLTSREMDIERWGRRDKKRDEAKRICTKLKKEEGISKETAEKIMALYHQIDLKHLAPKQIDITLCAIAIIACRNKKTPVGVKQVAQIVGLIPSVDSRRKHRQGETVKYFLSKKKQKNYNLVRDVNKRIRCLERELGIERTPIGTDEYIDFFCKKIGFTDGIAAKAKEIIKNIEIEKTTPRSIAVAAIRIAAPEKITTEKLVKITGVKDTTIRKAEKIIEEQ